MAGLMFLIKSSKLVKAPTMDKMLEAFLKNSGANSTILAADSVSIQMATVVGSANEFYSKKPFKTC